MTGPSYTYRAKAIEVHDGDSYTLEVDLGFDVVARVKVRLHGWSCPELDTDPGTLARAAALDLLMPAGPVALVAKTYKGRTFGRWLADLYLPDGRHLGEALEALGLARRGAFEG
jgi:endonuclease YncB( thermonuclease family)